MAVKNHFHSPLIACFRRINHMAVKNHLHSSSDVQHMSRRAQLCLKRWQPILNLTYGRRIKNWSVFPPLQLLSYSCYTLGFGDIGFLGSSAYSIANFIILDWNFLFCFHTIYKRLHINALSQFSIAMPLVIMTSTKHHKWGQKGSHQAEEGWHVPQHHKDPAEAARGRY